MSTSLVKSLLWKKHSYFKKLAKYSRSGIASPKHNYHILHRHKVLGSELISSLEGKCRKTEGKFGGEENKLMYFHANEDRALGRF